MKNNNNNNNISLNIISTLTLTKKIIKNDKEIFSNVIANIYFKTHGELGIFKENSLELNKKNLYIFFLRMFCLGYNNLNINVFSKNVNNDIDRKIDILNMKLDFYNSDLDNNYAVRYFNPIEIMNKKLINNEEGLLSNRIPSIYIFKEMSWNEVVIYFRKANIIISGGNVVERHILTNDRMLLSIFLKSISNLNNEIIIENNLTSSLMNLFKFNKKEFIKYLRSRYDLTTKHVSLNIDNTLNYLLNNNNNISEQLNIEIMKFKNNQNFIKILDQFLDFNTSNFDFSIFLKYLNDQVNNSNNHHDDYLELIDTFESMQKLILSDNVDISMKTKLKSEIDKIVMRHKLKNNNLEKKKKKNNK
jgi:CUB/sushi domain-containing protein